VLKAHLTFDRDSPVLSVNLWTARHRPMLYSVVPNAISVPGRRAAVEEWKRRWQRTRLDQASRGKMHAGSARGSIGFLSQALRFAEIAAMPIQERGTLV
jgi:hypothetical protein